MYHKLKIATRDNSTQHVQKKSDEMTKISQFSHKHHLSNEKNRNIIDTPLSTLIMYDSDIGVLIMFFNGPSPDISLYY